MSAPRRLAGRLDRFFFSQVDARTLAAFRIGLGAALLVTHLAFLPELEALFGATSMLRDPNPEWWRWSVYNGIADGGRLRAVHLALSAGPLLLMLGVGGRLSTLAALVTQLMVFRGSPVMLNSGDLLLRLWVVLLLAAPATRVWSVDAWLARRRGRPLPTTAPVFVHRLVALQLAVMYFDTGVEKFLKNEWTAGRATYYALQLDRLQRFPEWTTGALDHPLLVQASAVATYVTVYWELGWVLLVLWRPTRVLALVVGVLVHGGIASTMMVAQFSAAAVLGYFAYVDADAVGAWLDRRRGAQPSSAR